MNQPKPSNAPGTQYATGQEMLAYQNTLPGLLNTTAGSVGQTGQQLQNAQDQLAPQAQSLQNSLYGGYAPQLYQIGNLLNAINTGGGVGIASNLLGGAGGNLVNQATAANAAANPQYYQNAGAAGNQLTGLLGSYDPTGALTGSQTAQLSRGLAQQDAQKGILNSPSQTGAISNAMTFGNLQQQNKQNLASAIGTATSFLPSVSATGSGINGFNVGSGAATNQANAGAGQVLQPGQNQATNASSGALSLGNSLLGNTGQNQTTQSTVNASFPSTAQLWQNSALNSTGGGGGGGGGE